MANAAVSKVIYGNQTLVDLTQDDVTASDVKSGKYVHLPSGERVQGSLQAAYVTGTKLVLPNSTVSGNRVVIGE